MQVYDVKEGTSYTASLQYSHICVRKSISEKDISSFLLVPDFPIISHVSTDFLQFAHLPSSLLCLLTLEGACTVCGTNSSGPPFSSCAGVAVTFEGGRKGKTDILSAFCDYQWTEKPLLIRTCVGWP